MKKICEAAFLILLFTSSIIIDARSQYEVDTVFKLTNPQFAYPTLTTSGDIYFESDVEGNWEIYRMHAVTNKIKRLTHNKVLDRMPSYSSSNNKIVFISDRDGDFEIYTMDTVGNYQTQLTNNQTYAIHPYWAPDGKSVIFNELHVPSKTYDIKSINPQSLSITIFLNDDDLNSYAQQSPDGKYLIFDKWQDNNSNNGEIYLLENQTKKLKRLTKNTVYDGYPAWFSDSKHVVYSSKSEKYFKLYYMNVETPNPVQLTFGDYDDQRVHIINDQIVFNRNIDGDINIYKSRIIETAAGKQLDSLVQLTFPQYAYPGYSPDGEQIIYQAKFFDKWQLYKRSIKTGDVQRLTNKGNNEQACWSPDQKNIVFVSDISGHQNLALLDSSNVLRPLTNTASRNIHPFWHPDGHKIIFNREEDNKLEIWEYDLLTSKEYQLFTDSVHNSYASYSPDGNLIAYVRWLDNNGEIYLFDTATKQSTRITDHDAFDGYPRWMPDGENILFSSNRSGIFKLHLVNIHTRAVSMLNPEGKYPEVRADIAPSADRIILNVVKPDQLNLYEYRLSGTNQ